MNTTSEDRSRVNLAAQEGDIDGLYTVILENPHVLEDIDSIPFVDTPLHVAASVGNLEFATEVMRLKPSFALKLNPRGFTPIHLALQNGHDKVVFLFVEINKDLVRAKGRKGRTPLHLATKKGEINLLSIFLLACPDSIKDVTVRRETALHIAVRCRQYEALQVLVGWLMKTCHTGAMQLERTILNWKDVEGNTILHVSSRENNLQMVQLLVKSLKTRLNLKAKNFEERSAFDIATNEEIRSILAGTGADLPVTNVATYADIFKSMMTSMDEMITYIHRIASDITENQRNSYMIIATLVLTATYQSVLSPPGGFYQANAGDNNANATSLINSTSILNSTATAGTSVLSVVGFSLVSSINALSFLVSTTVIFILTPATTLVGPVLMLPILLLSFSYLLSMITISPTVGAPLFSFVVMIPFYCFLFLTLDRLYRISRGIYGGQENRW